MPPALSAAMCIAERLIRPAQELGPRFVNRDGATLVLERLGQRALADLFDWYVDRRGGDRGRYVLRQAPILDGWLAAAQPRIPCDSPGHGFGIGAVSLVAGLAVGSAVVDMLSPEVLFPEPPSFDSALRCLREARLDFELLTSVSPPAACAGVFSVFEGLQQTAPGLSLVLGSAFRLLSHMGEWRARRTQGISGSRYLLSMGLVGAGVRLPELLDGEERVPGHRLPRRQQS